MVIKRPLYTDFNWYKIICCNTSSINCEKEISDIDITFYVVHYNMCFLNKVGQLVGIVRQESFSIVEGNGFQYVYRANTQNSFT